eukprot:12209726-Ditylum_brightwellii.AAC.1
MYNGTKCTMASLYKTLQSLSNEACRWREFWHKRSIEHLNGQSNDVKPPPKEEGLGTGLIPEHYKPKPTRGSYNFEQFLELLETELWIKVLENGENHVSKDKTLNNFFSKSKQASLDIAVPIDKTNCHCLVDLTNYISWVKQHMREAATPIRCQEIVKLHHEAQS